MTGQSITPGTNDTDIATVAYDTTGAGTTDANFVTVAYEALSGAQVWSAQYNGPSRLADTGTSIAVSPSDATVVVTGQSDGATTAADYATVAYSPVGARLWAKRFNAPANGADEPTGVVFAPDGSAVYVTGSSRGVSSGLDYLTIGYTADGVVLWTDRGGGTGNGDDRPVGIDVDDLTGNLYVTGGSQATVSGLDVTTAVYDPAGVRLGILRNTGVGSGSDVAWDLAVSDVHGQVYVVGANQRPLTGVDYATLAYTLL